MTNLAIDIGNTAIKIGVFTDNLLVKVITEIKFDQIPDFVQTFVPNNIIISSVRKNSEALLARLPKGTVQLTHTTSLPITIAYETPETLGVDRIAAVVGAFNLFPFFNCLIIDVGTCITYEFLDAEGAYQGGSISPGIEMKFKALNNFTASLPLIERTEQALLVGKTTEQAIQSGVIGGTLAEIEEIIRMYNDKFSPLRIIMCGGGAKFIKSRLRSKVELYPELVLMGLNGILKHNA